MNGGGARGDAGCSPTTCSGGFGSGVGFGGEESGEERYEEEGGAGEAKNGDASLVSETITMLERKEGRGQVG
ncbi:uncharacterized protein A4U43_C03F3710 [Asparagus officinalis]|uniref:Uncharacterized protein n=1 Tax=Asparagus officinalis TaxID=4686 RepID=A0A5P1F747_ASPOF|nr:uncharacterized protein A4U43_C03F3710 [Asparagus officinalis]